MRRQWLITAWIVCAASSAIAQEQGPLSNPTILPMPRALPLPTKETKDTVNVPDPVPIRPPFVPPSSTVPPIHSMPMPGPDPLGPPPPALLPPYIPPSGYPPVALPPSDPYPIRTVEEELKKLRAAREELEATFRNGPTATTQTSESRSIDHDELLLKLRLGEVLHRLHNRHSRPQEPRPLKYADPHAADPHAAESPSAAQVPKESHKTSADPHDHVPAKSEMDHPVDALAMAHSLFLAGRPEEALNVFRKLDLKDFRPEDRMPIQCLMASCLRHMGRSDEAKDIYLKLANAKDDDQISSVAQWQLRQMRWRKDMNDLVDSIRTRRQSLEKAP
ncbi:MAG: hypothetical protein K2X38_23035 [Gemmataceae bacterium]|nr:hypothetical protein [Gemmataceae bacterium]